MSEQHEFLEDPSDWLHSIPQKIEELANAGETYEGGLKLAFYRSTDENVAYLLARAWPEQRPTNVNAALLIAFGDGSHYYMSWAEGQIWSLSHSVRSEDDARDPARVLPYSHGQLRCAYSSDREVDPAAEARDYLNLRNILTEGSDLDPFVAEEEVDDFIMRVMESVAELQKDPALDVLAIMSKAINPADLDLRQMLEQVQAVDATQDRLDAEIIQTEAIDPTDYAYMERESARIDRVLNKLDRQGKPEDYIFESRIKELKYLNHMSPHIGQHLSIKASSIRCLREGEVDSEPADVEKVSGILRSFIFAQWFNETTDKDEHGLLLMVELTKPYPESEFPDNSRNRFPNPVAFIPVNSITGLRRYHTLED